METTLVAGWEALCQLLAPAFTRPTFATFVHIVTGWVLCRSRPTVTNLVCTIGPSLLGHVAKHWTTYERFFYRAAWSMDEVSTLLLNRIVAPLVRRHALEPVIDLSIDDTTCGRYGTHVAYAGYFKDASASNAAQTVVHWAHNWIIGTVSIRTRHWPEWVLGLPVLFRLYRKRSDCDRQHPFRSRYQVAAEMIAQAFQALPGWIIRVAGDGQYATRPVVDAVRAGAAAWSRACARMRRFMSRRSAERGIPSADRPGRADDCRPPGRWRPAAGRVGERLACGCTAGR
jgi:hypothetical protein